MSKRCELQKEYYQQYGNYKGNGKYSDKYVSWLENEVLALRQPLVIKSVCEKYPKPTQRYCYECEGCKKSMSEQTDGKPPVISSLPDANPHQCALCGWGCTCSNQPCSCCSGNDH